MRIHVMDLQPGDRLTTDTFNSYGLHVLSADTVLDGEGISKLFCHNIDYVDIADRIIGAPTRASEKTADNVSQVVQMTYEASLAGVSSLFEQAVSDGKIDPRMVDASFEPLADSFSKQKDLVSLMLTLESQDDYTYQHSVQVGMFSYYISKWMGSSEESAVSAGKAGFLHDIGKSMIDPQILSKPAKLTEAEFAKVQEHTVLGYEILTATFDEKSPEALGALQHHERYDRRGYPHKVGSDEIHPVAKIISVADIYSAMISSRAYQKERDMLYVLKEIYRLSFGEIDPVIAQLFIKNMVPNFIGKKVQLNTGEAGLILMTHPTDYFRPLIQIGSEFIDLTARPDLSVEKILC